MNDAPPVIGTSYCTVNLRDPLGLVAGADDAVAVGLCSINPVACSVGGATILCAINPNCRKVVEGCFDSFHKMFNEGNEKEISRSQALFGNAYFSSSA